MVPDARVIGQQCDAMLYCVHWDRTGSQQIKDGLGELRKVNIDVSGLVFTQVNPRLMRKYGYGGRYGPYASYGGHYYAS